MRRVFITLLLVSLFLAACGQAATDSQSSTFVRSSSAVSSDANIVAEASRAQRGYAWDAEAEFFVMDVWDGDLPIGIITYVYFEEFNEVWTSNLTLYSNTERQDSLVWGEWNDLDARFFGRAFMIEVWDWHLSINEEASYPQRTIIDGRGVELDVNTSGFSEDDEAFILTHIFQVTP